MATKSHKLKLNVDKIQMFSRFAIKSFVFHKSRDNRAFSKVAHEDFWSKWIQTVDSGRKEGKEKY